MSLLFAEVQDIIMYVNSPGGSVTAGKIYVTPHMLRFPRQGVEDVWRRCVQDLIRRLEKGVRVRLEGSCAAVVFEWK